MLSEINRLRWRSILLGRSYKDLFLADGGAVKRSAGHVLADLRSFCRADEPTIFDKDPHEMARREGRREVFVRMINFLNLDEAMVQKIMELDDGIG